MRCPLKIGIPVARLSIQSPWRLTLFPMATCHRCAGPRRPPESPFVHCTLTHSLGQLVDGWLIDDRGRHCVPSTAGATVIVMADFGRIGFPRYSGWVPVGVSIDARDRPMQHEVVTRTT